MILAKIRWPSNAGIVLLGDLKWRPYYTQSEDEEVLELSELMAEWANLVPYPSGPSQGQPGADWASKVSKQLGGKLELPSFPSQPGLVY